MDCRSGGTMRTKNSEFLTCDICGKQFLKVYNSIYETTFQGKKCHFCSYTCFREAQKVQESIKSNHRLANRKFA